jgi:hypothetical protein
VFSAYSCPNEVWWHPVSSSPSVVTCTASPIPGDWMLHLWLRTYVAYVALVVLIFTAGTYVALVLQDDVSMNLTNDELTSNIRWTKCIDELRPLFCFMTMMRFAHVSNLCVELLVFVSSYFGCCLCQHNTKQVKRQISFDSGLRPSRAIARGMGGLPHHTSGRVRLPLHGLWRGSVATPWMVARQPRKRRTKLSNTIWCCFMFCCLKIFCIGLGLHDG